MNTSVRVPHTNSLEIQNSGFPEPRTPGPKNLDFQLPPLGNMGSPNSKDPQIASPPGYGTPGLQTSSLLRSFLLQRSRNPGSRPFMTQASRLGRAGSWIRNAVISRPLPAPLPGCPPPGPQLPSQSVFRLAGIAATGSLGPLAGGDSNIQPKRPGRQFGSDPRTEVELPLWTCSLPRSAPIYGRARVGEPRLLEQGLGESALRSAPQDSSFA